MEQITQWVTDNWVLLLAIGAAIETLAGIIPDKWVPYIGAIRTFFRVLKGKGKAGKASVGAMAVLAVLGALVLMAAGCAGMTHDQKLSAAQLIAGEAGFYVAQNNPEAAAIIAVTYEDIKSNQGLAYKASVASGLKWMLDQNNIKGSERLANSAERLLGIFGVPLPAPMAVDTAWLMQFDEPDIRSVAEAFIEGMGKPTSSVDEFRDNLRATMLENRFQFEIDHAAEIADMKTGGDRYLGRIRALRDSMVQ